MVSQQAVDPFSDDALLDRALKEAVGDALREHKLRGAPIVVARNGRIVWIPAEEIVIPSLD
jgi:hypothetical protein